MTIYNLGQYDKPNPSPLAGLDESIARGLTIRADKEKTAALLEQNKQETATTKALSVKQEFDMEQTTRKNFMDLLDKRSQYLNSKSPQEQELYKTTDQDKEFTKALKSHIPEMIDEKGFPMVFSNAQMAEDKIKTNMAQIQQKILQKEPLKPEEQQYMDSVNQYGPKALATAFDMVSSDPSYSVMSPEEKSKALRDVLDSMSQGRQMLQGGGAPALNPKNPLGIDAFSNALSTPQG